MVGRRSLWVADGAAVLFGNAIAGFHGGAVIWECHAGFHGAVLLGNALEGFHGAAVLLGNVIASAQTHCNGGLQVALGGATVFLGNAVAGFHGGAEFSGNAIEGFHCGAVLL